MLARAFPRGLVDEVIDAAGARERRRRVLPAWLTLYFTLALALFMDRGALRVMRKLAGVLAWAERGVTVTVPSEEALSNARARLGAEPVRLLFERVAGFVAPPNSIVAGVPARIIRERDSRKANRINAIMYHENAMAYARGDHRTWAAADFASRVSARLDAEA